MQLTKANTQNPTTRKVFGETRILNVAKTCLIVMGVWNVNLDLLGNLRIPYKINFIMNHTYLLIFMASEYIQAVILFRTRQWEEFTANLTITILYTVALFEIRFCRSKQVLKLLNNIEKFEKNIERDNDEDIKIIYEKYVKQANISQFIYIATGWISLSFYFIYPHIPVAAPKVDGSNETLEDKYMIFSNWLPFDKYEYNNYACAYQIVGGAIGGTNSFSSDAFFFSLFIFCIGYVKILQHYLLHIGRYSRLMRLREGLEYNVAEIVFTKRCVTMYQDIIEFVANLDQLLKTFMLFNFFQSSFKISLLLLQILEQSSFGTSSFTVFTYVIYSMFQLYFFYWNANELLYETSDGIMLAIGNSNWYTKQEAVKKMLLLTLVRAKIPCKIGVGPIYNMNLQAVINILRGCYTYVCVMHDFGS